MAITAASIEKALSVSRFQANLTLLLIRRRVDPTLYPRRFPQTCAWVNACYHPPRNNEVILEAINEIIGGSGVESVGHECIYVDNYYRNTIGSYVNTGDTYSYTILFDHVKKRWKLTTWGDFLETYDPTNCVGLYE